MLHSIQIGPLSLSTYHITYLLAFLAGLTIAVYRLREDGFGTLRPVGWIILVILGGVVGAGLFWQLVGLLNPARVMQPLREPIPGSTIIGGITLGGLTGLAICVWWRIPVGRFFDRGIPAVPLGQSIGRLGCLLAGCCVGRTTDSWLSMVLPGSGFGWANRYPVQILSSLANLVIFAALMVVDRRMAGKECGAPASWFPGSLTLLYLALYFTKRFGMEFLRTEQRLGQGPFTWAHAASLLGLTVVAVLWLFNRVRPTEISPPEER